MHIERLVLTNFRCFGPSATTIDLEPTLNAFVGDNGTGKTAVLQALQRLFGITGDMRRVRKQDFHVPHDEGARPTTRSLILEAIVAFPELDDESEGSAVVPEFFRNMAADDDGELKCRLRLEATWTDDGTLEGNIDDKYQSVQTFGEIGDDDVQDLRGPDRSRIQLFYIPATRDGASQVASFIKGRLWRAIDWSETVREQLGSAGAQVNESFSSEPAVHAITGAVTARWQQLHSAGTFSAPKFRPVDTRWQEFIRRVEVVFHPDEHGQERALENLSDGQRSLFHLAMAAATLDIEASLAGEETPDGFQDAGVPLPALTIVAIEEPENNLAPFYLSRIIKQVLEVADLRNAQAIVSSHSPSIMGRVDPDCVRHFRLDTSSKTSKVKAIKLPEDEDASKFIREAVRAYPELYFARYVILGEGATEEVVLPLLSKAMDFPIDRSFVAVVPLGGRHVNHLWRLLRGLQIPFSTLLDLDWGRSGGGMGRVRGAYRQLLESGITPKRLFGEGVDAAEARRRIAAMADETDAGDFGAVEKAAKQLRKFEVYFASPLDLDLLMLDAYEDQYCKLEHGRAGPKDSEPRQAVLGDDGEPDYYDDEWTDTLQWYRYLFLGRGKPSTHVRVLSQIRDSVLLKEMPETLKVLLAKVKNKVEGDDDI